MVRQSIKGSFRKYLIIVSVAAQLAGCGDGDSSADSSTSSVETAGNTVSTSASAVKTSSATLNWVAPVTRADGSPMSLADIDGYRVYYGTTEGNYTNRIDITDGTSEGTVLRGLPSGTNYIVVTTYDSAGRESEYSEVVIKII